MIKTIISFLFATFIIAHAASAQTFSYDKNELSFSYNTHSEIFSSSFNLRDGSDAWGVVVTNGYVPNKGVQLIGDIDNNIITAYSYTKGNGYPLRSDVSKETYLGTFNGFMMNNGQTYAVDLSDVNDTIVNMGGTPFAIDEHAGIWFKEGTDAEFIYASNGEIDHYRAENLSNIADFNKRPTIYTPPTAVSEPMGALIVLSALGLYAMTRKKHA